MTAVVYSKPAVRNAWGDQATSADLVDPGDAFAAAGWPQSTTPPARQYFNWALNYSMAGILYLCQNGVAAWDTAEEYPANAITIYNGTLYQAITANTGYEPDTSPGQWGAVGVAQPPPGSASNSAATTAWVSAGFLKVGSAFSVLSGSIAAGQVPQGAVTQYQGALSIAFGQLTGSIASAQVPQAAVTQYQASLSIAFTQLTGSIAAGQVPQGAVTQYQGNLSIGWGQLTGTKNADQLQGYVTDTAGGASTVALRDTNGGLTAATFNVSSDRNLKKNMRPILGALDRIALLKGVTYEWRRKGDTPRAGVIAQDVQAALPEAVRGDARLMVDPMGLIGLLVEGLKEERAARERLERRLAALEKSP